MPLPHWARVAAPGPDRARPHQRGLLRRRLPRPSLARRPDRPARGPRRLPAHARRRVRRGADGGRVVRRHARHRPDRRHRQGHGHLGHLPRRRAPGRTRHPGPVRTGRTAGRTTSGRPRRGRASSPRSPRGRAPMPCSARGDWPACRRHRLTRPPGRAAPTPEVGDGIRPQETGPHRGAHRGTGRAEPGHRAARGAGRAREVRRGAARRARRDDRTGAGQEGDPPAGRAALRREDAHRGRPQGPQDEPPPHLRRQPRHREDDCRPARRRHLPGPRAAPEGPARRGRPQRARRGLRRPDGDEDGRGRAPTPSAACSSSTRPTA